LPQWNCACPNCHAARQGLIPCRTQSSIAVSDGNDHWYLVNASPDLSVQLRQSPELQPRPQTARNTPIAGVFLTNADLDHVLGLFPLREGSPLTIYAPHAVHATVEDSLGMQTVLDSFCGSQWHELAIKEFAPLSADSTRTSALSYRAIELTGSPPPFAKSTKS